MLVNRYYVIYVEVPTGHLGVDLVNVPMVREDGDDVPIRDWVRDAFFHVYDRAVIDILEVR